MPKGKRKGGGGSDLRLASVHLGGILSAYQERPDKVAMVEAELSKLFSEYKDRVWLEDVKGLKPGKEGV